MRRAAARSPASSRTGTTPCTATRRPNTTRAVGGSPYTTSARATSASPSRDVATRARGGSLRVVRGSRVRLHVHRDAAGEVGQDLAREQGGFVGAEEPAARQLGEFATVEARLAQRADRVAAQHRVVAERRGDAGPQLHAEQETAVVIDEAPFGRDGFGGTLHRHAVERNVFAVRERLQHAQQRAAREQPAADALDRIVDREVGFARRDARSGDAARRERAQTRSERHALVAAHREAVECESARDAPQRVVDRARAALAGGRQLATFLARAAQRDHRRGDVLAGILGPRAVAGPGVRVEQQRDEPRDRPAGFGDAQLRFARVDAFGNHRARARQLDAARPRPPRRASRTCFEQRLHGRRRV